jgi:hypothetical protein
MGSKFSIKVQQQKARRPRTTRKGDGILAGRSANNQAFGGVYGIVLALWLVS